MKTTTNQNRSCIILQGLPQILTSEKYMKETDLQKIKHIKFKFPSGLLDKESSFFKFAQEDEYKDFLESENISFCVDLVKILIIHQDCFEKVFENSVLVSDLKKTIRDKKKPLKNSIENFLVRMHNYEYRYIDNTRNSKHADKVIYDFLLKKIYPSSEPNISLFIKQLIEIQNNLHNLTLSREEELVLKREILFELSAFKHKYFSEKILQTFDVGRVNTDRHKAFLHIFGEIFYQILEEGNPNLKNTEEYDLMKTLGFSFLEWCIDHLIYNNIMNTTDWSSTEKIEKARADYNKDKFDFNLLC